MADNAAKIDDDGIIQIPDDSITVGNDPDGLPKTVAAEPATKKVAAPATEKREPDRLAILEREKSDALRAADEARQQAAQAAEIARAEAARRAEAEKVAGTRTEQAMRAHWAKINADHQQIVGAMASAEQMAEAAQREHAQALEAGDHARAASAQRALAKAEATLSQLSTGKTAAEDQIAETRRLYEEHAARRTEEARAPAPQSEPQRQQPTPETWIENTKHVIGDQNATWLRENRQFVEDAKLNKKFLRFAEEFAEDHGQHALKSEAFKEALDAKFFPDKVRDDEIEVAETRTEKPRTRVQPAAPVQRGSHFSSRNMSAGTVKLPAALAAKVKQMGLDPVKYALSAVADIKAGKLPKDFLDPEYDHG